MWKNFKECLIEETVEVGGENRELEGTRSPAYNPCVQVSQAARD